METVKQKRLAGDENGAAILEFSIVAGVMFMMLFGLVEFSNLFGQWNSATKAVQVGARLAAVSGPVWQELENLDGTEGDNGNNGSDFFLGEPLAWDYKVVCDLNDCDITGGSIPNNTGSTPSLPALQTLVFGRNSAGCNDGAINPGMCDVYKRIDVENVRVTYEHTDLGYIGRPGGLVPTITVEVLNLPFQFIFLDDIMGLFGRANLNEVAIPGLRTTISAEDMRTAAPNFESGNGSGNNGGGGSGGGNNGNNN